MLKKRFILIFVLIILLFVNMQLASTQQATGCCANPSMHTCENNIDPVDCCGNDQIYLGSYFFKLTSCSIVDKCSKGRGCCVDSCTDNVYEVQCSGLFETKSCSQVSLCQEGCVVCKDGTQAGYVTLQEGKRICENLNSEVGSFTRGEQCTGREEPGSMTVSGYITDIDSGNPIEDAAVVAPGKTAKTDNQGYYSLINIPTGSYTIITSAAGYETNLSDIEGKDGDVKELNIKLEKSPNAALSGTVVDTQNVKLRGVLIRLVGNRFERVAYTNTNGEYSITNIPAGSYTVTASKTGYSENKKENVDLIEGPNELNFILVLSAEKLGTVVGHVYNRNGDPLQDATVAIAGREAQTDESGYYILTGITARDQLYEVAASKEGYMTQIKPVKVLEGQEVELDFYLEEYTGPPRETANIRVFVQEAGTMYAVPNAKLKLTRVDLGSFPEVEADKRGMYLFEDREKNYDYYVSGRKDGYKQGRTETFTLKEDTTVYLTLEKLPTHTVTVKIKNISNEPLEDINVFLKDTSHSKKTDSSGVVIFNNVVEGDYELNAQDPTNFYASNKTIVTVDSDKLFIIIMLKAECVADRGSLVLEPVEVVKESPYVELNWDASCPVENFYVYRCEGTGCEPEGSIGGSGKTTTYMDKIEERTHYCYKIEARYQPQKHNSLPDLQFSEIQCVDTGDEYCFQPQKEFCTNGELEFMPRTHRSECDDLNFIVNIKDCRELGENYMCAGPDKYGFTTCVQSSECDSCNDPFGIFGFNGKVEYEYEEYGRKKKEEIYCNDPRIKTCYADYTNTSIDKYYYCDNVSTCYDYRSKQTCVENRCLGVGCEWEDYSIFGETYPEVGFGVCHPVKEELQNCSLCGGDQYNKVFGNCTQAVCDLFGECYYSTEYSLCLHKREATCFDYGNEKDCTGRRNVDVDVRWNDQEKERGTNVVLQRSLDFFGFGKCKWDWIESKGKSHCFKDSDDSFDSLGDDEECEQMSELACRRDVVSPETVIPYTNIVKEFNFQVFVTDINGIGEESTRENIKTYYCVASEEESSEGFGGRTFDPCANCYPKTEVEKDTETEEYNISEIVGDGRYALCYFSEDESRNLERVKQFYVVVDTAPPIVALTYTEEARLEGNEWLTDLTINLNVNEMSACKGKFYDSGGNNLVPANNIDETGRSWTRIYPDLVNGDYTYSYECIDAAGNIVSDDVVIHIDGNKKIYDQKPIGTIATDKPLFSVKTKTAATCKYSEIPVLKENFNQIKNTFETTDRLYHTKQTDFSPETSGSHEFWVYCKFMNGEILGDEGDKIMFTIDTIPPTTEVRSQQDLTQWFKDQVSFELTCRDPLIIGGLYEEFGCRDGKDGVGGVYYCDDAYNCDPVYEGKPVVVKTVEKPRDIYFLSKDNGSNTQLRQHYEIRIDKQKPMIDKFDTPRVTKEKTIMIEGDIGNYVFYDETANDLDELADYNFKNFDFKTRLKFGKDIENDIYEFDLKFRYQNEDNHYLLKFDILREKIELLKVVNGGRVFIGEKIMHLVENEWHDLAIETEGSRIEIYYDDKKIIEATDSTFEAGLIKLEPIIEEYKDISISDERLASPIVETDIYLNKKLIADNIPLQNYHFRKEVDLELNQDNFVKIYVRDEAGWYNEIYFTVTHDDRAPHIIEKKAIPEVIADIPLEAQLYVKTDDDTVCKYSEYLETAEEPYPEYKDLTFPFDGWDENDPDAYKKENYASLVFDSSIRYANYSYLVACKNLADLYSTTERIDLEINLDAPLQITVNSPPRYTKETDITLDISTNKRSDCTYNGNTMTPLNEGRQHTAHLGTLAPGDHTYSFECRSRGTGQEKKLDYTFTIDITKPGIPTITAANKTCFADRLSATFSATDPESGIAGYNYTIKNGTTRIMDWKYTTSSSVTESGLKLVNSISYNFVAKARNRAGIDGDEGTSSSIVVDSTDPYCTDVNPPTVATNTTPCSGNMCLSLYCYDDTACSIDFKYGTSLAAGCNASIEEQLDPRENYSYYFYGPIVIDKPMYFCYEVSDVTGKTRTGVQFVSFPAGTECNNSRKDENETDIDCGGVCPGCDAGKKCNIDSDCKSGYCKDGICASPSCDDHIKNRDETDIDCGGYYCDPCELGQECETGYDCASGYCNPSGLCDAASCTDNIKNGNETDIDCGGNCPQCPNEASCLIDEDCESGNCEYGKCTGEKDTDGDGIPDWWEDKYCGGDCDPYADLDNDGLNNLDEYHLGTDPTNADTDGDRYNDGREVKAGTDPLDPLSHPKSKALPTTFLTLGLLSTLGGAGYLVYVKYFKKPPAGGAPPSGLFVKRLPVTPRMSPEEIRRRQEAMRIRRELMEKRFRERQAKEALERESLFEKFGEKAGEEAAKKRKKSKKQRPPSEKYLTMEELAKKAEKKKKPDVFKKLEKITQQNRLPEMKKTEAEVAGLLRKEPFEELAKIEKGRTKKEVEKKLKKLAKKRKSKK